MKFLLFSLTLCHGSFALAADAYEALSGAVVRLRHFSINEALQVDLKASAGTAFFVSYKGSLYLVSAGHMKRAGELAIRVPGAADLVIPRQAWILHPSPQNATPGQQHDVNGVDVAVARVELPPGFTVARLCVTDPATDPQPAESVIVAGYPRDFAIVARIQRPLLRQGIVAMTSDEPYIKYAGDHALADSRVRVLDVRTFAGNSGSPVFRAEGFPSKLVLAGLVSSGDEDLGLAFAEPVSRILETIRHAHEIGGSSAPAQARWLGKVPVQQ